MHSSTFKSFLNFLVTGEDSQHILPITSMPCYRIILIIFRQPNHFVETNNHPSLVRLSAGKNFVLVKLAQILSVHMKTVFKENNLVMADVGMLTELASLDEAVTLRGDNLFVNSSKGLHLMFEYILKLYDCFKITYFSFDNAASITPNENCMSHNLMFVAKLVGKTYEVLKEAVISSLRMLLSTALTIVECKCNSQVHTLCSCRITSSCRKDSEISSYDPDLTPNFVSDIPLSFSTASFAPEITVSYKDKLDHSVLYRNVHHSDYKLSELEENYFKKTYGSSRSENHPKTKLLIGGSCVATICHDENVLHCELLTVTFHSNDILFSCYDVKDLRYIWTEDETFRADLSSLLVSCVIVSTFTLHMFQHI